MHMGVGPRDSLQESSGATHLGFSETVSLIGPEISDYNRLAVQ